MGRMLRPHRVVALALLVSLGAWLLLSERTEEGGPGKAEDRVPRPAEEPGQGLVLVGLPLPVGAPVAPADPKADPALPSAASGPYVIEGVVRDVATQGPVTGALVVGVWHSFEPQASKMERHEFEAREGADGGFETEVKDGLRPDALTFQVKNAAWQLIRTEHLDERIVLWVCRAFRLKGVVEDAQGKPLPLAQVTLVIPRWFNTPIVLANTFFLLDAQGRFDIGPIAEDFAAGFPEDVAKRMLSSARHIVVKHEGLATVLLDPRSIAVGDRDRVVIVLTPGITLAGVVVDERGVPLSDVPVALEYGDAYELRRGVRTDAQGRWKLERLSPGSAVLRARAFAQDAKAQREVTVTQDELNLRLVAEPIRLTRPPATTQVLGLSLAEVDDDLRRAYDVPDYVHVLILDTGAESEKLGIGKLEKGYGLWMVGDKPVTSIREALEHLIDPESSKGQSFPGGRRVVYTFWNENMTGTNTQHLRPTPAQIEELTALRERLR